MAVGFVVNVPVISQTSTAVTIGSVLIPLLLAARLSPVTVGAALLLGSSVGGELLNPGAPELRTVVEETGRVLRDRDGVEPGLSGLDCVDRLLPLNLVQLAVSTAVFWALSLRVEARARPGDGAAAAELPADFRVSVVRAAVPLVPLFLLFLTSRRFNLVAVPLAWLVERPADPPTADQLAAFDSRLIGAAMLAGAVVAAVVVRQKPSALTAAFFQGTGYAFTHIISIIAAANCFGKAVDLIGLAEAVGSLGREAPHLLLPLAWAVALGFAALSGSGMAATQSLFGFFAAPAVAVGLDPLHVGAVVSLAAAAGRTMSPVAAVTLMSAELTHTSPFDLARRVAVPLLAGAAAMLAAAILGVGR